MYIAYSLNSQTPSPMMALFKWQLCNTTPVSEEQSADNYKCQNSLFTAHNKLAEAMNQYID